MSFQIGQNYEGLHEGRWFSCFILSQEDEGYKVTFENWNSRYDAILPPQCLRSRSPAIAECRQSKKRQRLPVKESLVNFNKLLPEDEVVVDVNGTKKSATVRIIDPFLELLTVEMEKEDVMVPFHSVFLPDNEPAASVPAKKKKQATPRVKSPPIAAPTTSPIPTPAPVLQPVLPQYVSVVRPDGVVISCADLVTFSPTCTDLAFMVAEIYQQDSREMMRAQRCKLTDGVASMMEEDVNMTCPVISVHHFNSKSCSNLVSKTMRDLKTQAIVRSAESLRHYAGNREYQLRFRKHELAAKLREEIQRAMTTKAARTCTLKVGPANLSTDLELLSLTMESGFRAVKSKDLLEDLDPLLGRTWDVKTKSDGHFFYVTHAEFVLDISNRSLSMKIKFAESTCTFRPDSYRADTGADCC